MSPNIFLVATIAVQALLVHQMIVLIQASSVSQNHEVLSAEQQDESIRTTNDLQDIDSAELAQLSSRKCVPMLNFATYFTTNRTDKNPIDLQAGQQQALTTDSNVLPPRGQANINEALSFAIGDIDMPIVTTGGSIHSAMKLLSAFDSQFSDLDGDSSAPEASLSSPPPENVISFRQNKLHISGLNLSMLNVHLYPKSQPKFGLGITIKNATLTGRFVYQGPSLLIGSSKLAGNYRMSIDNFLITSSSNLTKIPLATTTMVAQNSTDPLAIAKIWKRLTTNDFQMSISNLGFISIEILDANDATKPTSNYLLRVLQRVLQKTIKRTYYSFESYIRDTLEFEGRRFLDCELTRFTPILNDANINTTATNAGQSIIINATDLTNESLQNDLAQIISNEITKSQLDRVMLPNFEYQRGILGTNATIFFSNGSLQGLDHVRLNNETRIKLQDNHLLINASVGWNDLRPHYNWSLYFGGIGPINHSLSAIAIKPTSKGFVAFNLKTIDFDAVISKGLGPQTKITVDDLIIRRFDNPKMDIGGLPGMNRVARGLVNFFVGRLKSRVANSIQQQIKEQLELSLNRLNLFK